MAVECYALVVFDRPLSDEERTFRKQLDAFDEPGSKWVREIKYHFCHLKLVQPIPKGNSQPKPKWEIVSDDYTMGEDEYREIRERTKIQKECVWYDENNKIAKGMLWCEDSDSAWKALLPKAFVTLPLKLLDFREPIDDRRIQLSQIRYLFPETATMPLAIALDYVRDRI